MFIGHYAPVLLAAAVLPRAPRLGALFLAAQLVDVAFFLLVLGGVEHMAIVPGFTVMNAFDLYDMRWTHSLVGTLGWAGLFALAARLLRFGWSAALIGAAVVASHWFIDLLVHAPDLTLAGVPPRYGFGLWNLPEVAMPLELALVAGTLTAYASRTKPRGRPGVLSLAALIGAMLTVQAINWFTPHPAAPYDPLPGLPLAALAAYALLTAIAWWTGLTRERR